MASYDKYLAEAAFMGAKPEEDHVAKFIIKHLIRIRDQNGNISFDTPAFKEFLTDIKDKNYIGGTRDDTISHHFVNAIIKFGIYHRQLDGIPKNHQQALSIVENITNKLTNTVATTTRPSFNTAQYKIWWMNINLAGDKLNPLDILKIAKASNKILTFSESSLSIMNLGNTIQGNNQEIIAPFIKLMSYIIVATIDANSTINRAPDEQFLTTNRNGAIKYKVLRETLNEILRVAFLVGNDTFSHNPNNPSGTVGLGNNQELVTINPRIRETSQNVQQNVLTFIKTVEQIDAFTNNLHTIIINYIGNNQQDHDTIKKKINDQKLIDIIKDDLLKKVSAGVKDDINRIVGTDYANLETSKEQLDLFNRIFAKWNTLDESVRNFYNNNVQIRINETKLGDIPKLNSTELKGADGMVSIESQHGPKVLQNLDNIGKTNVRINLKKVQIGSEFIPIFATYLPKYNKDKYDNITRAQFTVINNLLNLSSLETINLSDYSLRDIYLIVYGQLSNFAITRDLSAYKNTNDYLNLPTDAKYLPLNTEKNISDRIAAVLDRRVVPSSRQFDESRYLKQVNISKLGKKANNTDYTDVNEFISANGNVLRKDPNDNTRFQRKDGDKWNDLKISTDLCKPLNLDTVRDTNCPETVEQCILQDDASSLNKCLAKLTLLNFAQAAWNEISMLSPAMAVRLLQRIGFKAIKKDGMWQVQSVNEWENRVTVLTDNTNTQQSFIVLKGNNDFKKYLAILVHYVNANPSVLNSGYKGPAKKVDPIAAVASISSLSDDQKQKLKAMGISIDTRSVSFTVGEPGATRALASAQKSIQSDTSAIAAIMSLLQQTNSIGRVRVPFMAGGAYTWENLPTNTKNLTGEQIEQLNNKGSYVLKGMIEDIKRKLLSQNKTLDKADESKIEKHLKDMSDAEEELANDFRLLSEYYSIINQYDDTSVEEINTNSIDLAALKANLEKTHAKLSKESRFLLAVLNMLGKAGHAKSVNDGTTVRDGTTRELSI